MKNKHMLGLANSTKFTLLVSLFFTLIFNSKLWVIYFDYHEFNNLVSFLQLLGFGLFIYCLITSLLLIFNFKYIQKPIYIIFLLVSAPALYFSLKFNVIFDKSMIRNVLVTDTNEALDLISFSFVLTILFLGVMPAWFIWKLPLTYRPFLRQISMNTILVPTVFALSFVWTLPFYGEISSFIRAKRTEILLSMLPSAPIHSLYKNVRDNFQELNIQKQLIDQNAQRIVPAHIQSDKPLALVVMIGETARHKSFIKNAPNNSDFKPLLSRDNLTYFNNTWSCGTNTVESIPCMVSTFGKKDYKRSYLKQYENVFEMAHRLDVNFMWIKNNHCKHVCDQLPHLRINETNSTAYAHEGEFYDQALIPQLKHRLSTIGEDQVVVLHQLGSHGPAYYKRTPQQFEVFKPSCMSINFGNCNDEEITNAYNNTIYYTKYIIGQTIELLKQQSESHRIVFIYMSDHGESTGENGYYLHGLPYFMAPEEQIHIPSLIWMSDNYIDSEQIDTECMKDIATNRYSHDNLSHTILGVLNIQTSVYKKQLDILEQCRKSSLN